MCNKWWDLTYSENHWSNFDTTKHFVENVMVPYQQAQIELLELHIHKKMFWWLDCWSGHKSQKFFDCIKEKHPNMLVVFVPTNYIRMFSNQLMLFCSTHSSMHSKWCSTISQLESSNNKLEMAKIPMLISKWAIWNHRFVSGQTMHGKN